ncbi:SBBP repeat-containing protein [Fuerstiella marisgermanici]|uniref:Beta-propeller repeat n=1 Tax=Fuerstiella marisgermanici TaxID=1891926 RepID=A0A1P8WEC5_9PLAN|nr:SBBP repeat-containing protein [Fuerstiella marisgermanici]APZ92424.1 Beta-propeller repeat [Fuerstiella marisgermanici]
MKRFLRCPDRACLVMLFAVSLLSGSGSHVRAQSEALTDQVDAGLATASSSAEALKTEERANDRTANAIVEYELSFSTFLGGSDWEHARDVFVDDAQNVYIVGGTQSDDFPVTEGAFQTKHDMAGQQIGSGGYCDAFVCKFAPDGKLLWSTLLGGPNYDRAYAVEVDNAGYVYVSGRGGPGFPVTDESFQSEFRGTDAGIYGMQNGFLCKLQPDGSALDWSAFVGVGQLCRDVSVDAAGDVYVALHYGGKGPLPPKSWFVNAYQPTPAGDVEIGAVKIAGDGSRVHWATWFGGSGKETSNCGLRLDQQNNVYLNFTTQSSDMPTTIGAHDRTYNGNDDAFIAKLSSDGSKLLFGTYFGGSEMEEGNSTHNLCVDNHGNAYLSTITTSRDLPTTAGAWQTKMAGGQNEIALAKFSADAGALLSCTYVGGTSDEEPDGIYTDKAGNVFFTGKTSSADFPVTPGAVQSQRSGQYDATLVLLSADFSTLKYSTFLGGENYDYGRSGFLDHHGNLFVTGSINGPGWPAKNAHQPHFAGGGGGKELCYEGGCYAGDVILSKLVRKKK